MRDNLELGSVGIRAYRPDDTELLYAAVCESIPEVSRYETWCHPDYSLEEANEYVTYWIKMREEGQAFYYAVEDLKTGTFLGSCGISSLSREHKRAMLGYWIRTGHTRQGIATSAARLVAQLGFEDLDLSRIELPIAVDNVASCRVAEKIGAIREGILRKWLILPVGPADVAMYSLLSGELRLE